VTDGAKLYLKEKFIENNGELIFMHDWIPLIIFFTIFSISFILRYLASKNLLGKYSDKRSNVFLNTKGSWYLNEDMFNKKGKRYYTASNSMGFLWTAYFVIILLFHFYIRKTGK